MKRFSGLLATIVVIMLSVQTTGCTFQAPSPTATGTPAITTSAAAQTIEQARQQLQDKGFAVVGSMQMASDLASFSVAIPTFVPQGFYAQNYSDSGAYVVDDMDFGLPSSHFKYPQVSMQFMQKSGPPQQSEPWFAIAQSPDEVVGSGTPVDIGGHPGQKTLLPGDKDKNQPATIQLLWSDGTTFYQLDGRMISPLDEATLLKVAGSVTAR